MVNRLAEAAQAGSAEAMAKAVAPRPEVNGGPDCVVSRPHFARESRSDRCKIRLGMDGAMLRKSVRLGLLAAMVGLPLAAHAGHHQWTISELFTNADGTVQFVELKGTANGEGVLSPWSVATTGTTATSKNLAPDLPSATQNRYLLLGTAGYAALAALQGAPAPDRTLPDNFLEVLTADTVIYAGLGGAATRAYGAGGIPTNGVDSLDYEHDPNPTNTPTNYAQTTGSINAAPAEIPALPRFGALVLIGLVVLSAGVLLRRRSAQTI